MKLLLVLLVVTSCGMPDSHTKNYFTILVGDSATDVRCLKLTHDKTLKECADIGGHHPDIMNAANIIMVH